MQMRADALLIVAVFGAAVLAGCVSNNEPTPTDTPDPIVPYTTEVNPMRLPDPKQDFTNAIDPDHGGIPNGHAIQALHQGFYGMKLVGYNPLTNPTNMESPTGQDSGYIAMDTWSTWACIAHFAGTGGATIVDIKDPTKPTVVSSVDSGAANSDCQFTDDGNYLLVAAYTGVTPGVPALPPPIGDAGAQGVTIFDVKDKAKPKYITHDSQAAGGGGYHNVFTATINGTIYIYQTYTGQILKFDPVAAKLTLVNKVKIADHDIWVGRHPITGNWTMITGGEEDGVAIYDLTNPAKPARVGGWKGHDEYTGWHRQWPLMNTVNGSALMVVAGETGGGGTLPYTVLNFTDVENVTEMGHWEVPGQPNSPPPNFFTLGPHEFETWDGYVATGNYHSGVWLFDIGTLERAMNPVTIGYYLPHEVPQTGLGTTNKPFAFNPDVWGAYFDDRGYILTADWGTGLYILSFDATPKA